MDRCRDLAQQLGYQIQERAAVDGDGVTWWDVTVELDKYLDIRRFDRDFAHCIQDQ